jgi:hypothetical protein
LLSGWDDRDNRLRIDEGREQHYGTERVKAAVYNWNPSHKGSRNIRLIRGLNHEIDENEYKSAVSFSFFILMVFHIAIPIPAFNLPNTGYNFFDT